MAQRKLKTLPLKRKLDLIHEVENNPLKKRKDIAGEFNIPSNTLSAIMRGSEKYKDSISPVRLTSRRRGFAKQHTTTQTKPCWTGSPMHDQPIVLTTHLLKLIAHIDAGMPKEDFGMTIVEAMTMLKQADDRVTSTTIRNCFRKAGFVTASSNSVPIRETWEECEKKLMDIIHNKMKIDDNIVIDSAHCVGKAIIVAFRVLKDKQ
ncbi:hypothetical protein ACOMHN_038702 [Nucella lapillus]